MSVTIDAGQILIGLVLIPLFILLVIATWVGTFIFIRWVWRMLRNDTYREQWADEYLPM